MAQFRFRNHKKNIQGLSISNGQHLIDGDNNIVGYVSTPIGKDPSWKFHEKPYIKANQALINNAIDISKTELAAFLFQGSVLNKPPFKTSNELKEILESTQDHSND